MTMNVSSARQGRRALQTDQSTFTPRWLVRRLFAHKVTRRHMRDASSVIVNPIAGDGKFFLAMMAERLRIHKSLDSVDTLYATDANLLALEFLKEAVHDFLVEKSHSDPKGWTDAHVLAGDFSKEDLALPEKIDFVIGNVALQRGRRYQGFCTKALATGGDVLFIVPTSWLHSDGQAKFAAAISPHLREAVEKLPWDSFSVKMRTCQIWLKRGSSRSPKLDYQQDAIWLAASQTWDRTINSFAKGEGEFEAYLGWKSNLERGTGKINAFQSLSFDKNDPGLPLHYTTLKFRTATERKNFARFMATKLAAYLQTCTDSDNVSMSLPVPPLNLSKYDDETLMDHIELTDVEKATVEIFQVYISGKAAAFLKEQGIALREDALLGALRKGCAECGSSSFHRKGCSFSTTKERSTRDTK